MNASTILPAGKLPNALLDELLRRFPSHDPRLIVGPQMGVDAAVIDFGATYLVAKTDPITFATDAIGWYAVNVNANDIAVMGGTPRWFLATALLPEGKTTPALAEAIYDQLAAACAELGVALAGGHTEITVGLDRPIIVGAMLGEVEPARLVRSSGVRPGDSIVLVGSAAIEGTAIIARERERELLDLGFDPALVRRSQAFLYDPGISVVRAARLATQAAAVHAMHDPTEGGLATGLWEMAQASGVGLAIDFDAVPVAPETQALCDAFGLDPLGVIASGALLVALAAEEAPRLQAELADAGLTAAVIGRAVVPEEGLTARRGGRPTAFPRFPVDEIARLFA
ncbi:MAG: AIR synthase family protein [Caldilineales bacterium]|nr:AIR synthase family protein [Caldilineales bacterium]MDW8318343.1 AIR synthase family protein [Anaerolineae bacterium]